MSDPLCDPLLDHEAYERCEVERQKAERMASSGGLAYARIQDEKVVDFLRDADVVIADSQYDAIEYPSRRGWGHTCADDTVQLAVRAGAKRLQLFSHLVDGTSEVGQLASDGRYVLLGCHIDWILFSRSS